MQRSKADNKDRERNGELMIRNLSPDQTENLQGREHVLHFLFPMVITPVDKSQINHGA
jgi:hypothetical protein